MNELECSGLCPSVCFRMCASVSHPKCVLSAQVSILERRRMWARVAAIVKGGSWKGAVLKGGWRGGSEQSCFTERWIGWIEGVEL